MINSLLADNVNVPHAQNSNSITTIISVSIIGDGMLYVTGSVNSCEMSDCSLKFDSTISLEDAFGFMQSYDAVNISNVEFDYTDQTDIKSGLWHVRNMSVKDIDDQKQLATLSLHLCK